MLQRMGIRADQWPKIQLKTIYNFWHCVDCFPFPFLPFLVTIHVSDWHWNLQLCVNDSLSGMF